jgi:hypothetical protein
MRNILTKNMVAIDKVHAANQAMAPFEKMSTTRCLPLKFWFTYKARVYHTRLKADHPVSSKYTKLEGADRGNHKLDLFWFSSDILVH